MKVPICGKWGLLKCNYNSTLYCCGYSKPAILRQNVKQYLVRIKKISQVKATCNVLLKGNMSQFFLDPDAGIVSHSEIFPQPSGSPYH